MKTAGDLVTVRGEKKGDEMGPKKIHTKQPTAFYSALETPSPRFVIGFSRKNFLKKNYYCFVLCLSLCLSAPVTLHTLTLRLDAQILFLCFLPLNKAVFGFIGIPYGLYRGKN